MFQLFRNVMVTLLAVILSMIYVLGMAQVSIIGIGFFCSDKTEQSIFRHESPFCHQKRERSFSIFNRQMPLCARCVGIYGGICLWAILKRLGIPRPNPIPFMGLLALVALGDVALKPFDIDSPNGWRIMAGMALGGWLVETLRFLRSVFSYSQPIRCRKNKWTSSIQGETDENSVS